MKKGFTLIEMLGIIAVLAVVLLVTFPVMNKSLKKMKENTTNNFENNLKISAETYIELNRDNYENIDVPGTEIAFTIQDLYDTNLLKGQYDNINTTDKIKVIVGQDLILRYYFNGEQIGIDKEIDDNLTREIALIKENLNQSTPDGIYYYTEQGNLENNPTQINLTRNWGKPYGNILVHNHQFISGCIQFDGKNYDYYKGELTELNYPCSTIRGENLVVNGDLSYKDNTNYSALSAYNDEGFLTRTSNSMTQIYNLNYVPINVNKPYEFGMTVRSNNDLSKHYAGFFSYDIDKKMISPTNVMYINNTLTTLSKDLNNGDEYVYLTDLTNWKKINTEDYQRGFIFWNYKDSTGYEYPELTYSRNISNADIYSDENIDLENNRIKLNAPWNNGYIKAGTKLSQRNNGITHNYNLMQNQKIPNTFTNYSSVVSQFRNVGSPSNKEYKHGTRYVRWFIWTNYNNTANTTVDFKDIYIREVTE